MCVARASLSACGNNSTTMGWMAAGKKRGWLLFYFCFFVFILKVYIMHTHWFVRKEKKTLLFLFLKRVAGFGLLIDLTRVLLMVNLTTRQQQQEKKSSR